MKYHEEFEKKIKGSKIEVVDDPESKRLKRLGSLVSQVEYKRSDSADSTSAAAARRSSLTHTPPVVTTCMYLCTGLLAWPTS